MSDMHFKLARVMDSCSTAEQLKTAEAYAILWLQRMVNNAGSDRLTNTLNEVFVKQIIKVTASRLGVL